MALNSFFHLKQVGLTKLPSPLDAQPHFTQTYFSSLSTTFFPGFTYIVVISDRLSHFPILDYKFHHLSDIIQDSNDNLKLHACERKNSIVFLLY